MNKAYKTYQSLLKHFGPQGWWPLTPKGKFHPAYHPEARTSNLLNQEMFEICVGALLTQNTAWSNVEKALVELNKAGVLTPQKLVKISFSRLARLIRSSGYFRQKSKRLKIFSKYLMEHYQGEMNKIFSKPLMEARKELLACHGIGPETADSILLYAGSHPIFVVDAYTRRIGNRVGLFHSQDYSHIQEYFQANLHKSSRLFNEIHALLVQLGKEFCRTKPLCEGCPLNKDCAYYLGESLK
ncbi:MAG: hypothetical protein HYT97_06870 [Elusimicrobia bacterium]|nr:hypothetical protein [Elusimicrobiota bacterium]